MSINYHMRTRERPWVEKYFGREYDEPGWGYEYEVEYAPAGVNDRDGTPLFAEEFEIHVGKQSWGWEPLLQWHPNAYRSFAEMCEFMRREHDHYTLFDEYDETVDLEEYLRMVADRQIQEVGTGPLCRHIDGIHTKFIHDRDGYSFSDRPFS